MAQVAQAALSPRRDPARRVRVRITEPKSTRAGWLAWWYPGMRRVDQSGDEWYLLQFDDGFQCWFPRDEFREVER